MGVKVQFIHGWRMHQLVIGFQHFPESHTGDNIKRCLQSILEKYGITNDKVILLKSVMGHYALLEFIR